MSRYKLTVEVDDLGDLTRVSEAIDAALDGPAVKTAAPPKSADKKPDKKTSAKKAAKKTTKKAAAKTKSAIDDLLGSGDDEDDEPEARTRDEVMAAFERVAEAHGEGAAPAILQVLRDHGCEKLSDLEEDNYGSVYAALEEMLG